MDALRYVDLETARAATGLRMVCSSVVASPWTEAAKGLFRLVGAPALAVHVPRVSGEVAAWTGGDSVPAVIFDDEPVRHDWLEILVLAERLASPGALVPARGKERLDALGLLHAMAGREGLGWCGRLLILDASFSSGGARGFSLSVAKYLGGKYGYTEGCADGARRSIVEILAMLDHTLSTGRPYLNGEAPGALDVYLATFLHLVDPVPEAWCPQVPPPVRAAFEVVRTELAAPVPPALLAHRALMYERHLGLPIIL